MCNLEVRTDSLMVDDLARTAVTGETLARLYASGVSSWRINFFVRSWSTVSSRIHSKSALRNRAVSPTSIGLDCPGERRFHEGALSLRASLMVHEDRGACDEQLGR